MNAQLAFVRKINHPLTQVVLTVLLAAMTVHSQTLSLKPRFQKGDFQLVSNNLAAGIAVSSEDFTVVQIAAADLAKDIETVTGKRPIVGSEPQANSRNIVIAGTLGKNKIVDGLVKRGKLDVSQIRGKWESYLIATVKDPMPNVESALVIVGSDRRGTAYGIYELSQMIGVSPWHWWADVTPGHKENLIISNGKMVGREPSVKYRGIFINDEDWGLQPWAAKTFEPETGNIGPKTYAKVCELLLRLKANTLWPAMHEVSTPFNAIAANRQVADDYAIVMGSSHAEPMLRNNVGEWKAKPEEFNFVTNPTGVTNYWEQRVRENGKFENIYTIGMRGIHDSAIQGPKTQAERIPLLENIFALQRGLLSKYVRADVETVPQIFCPYKEVLADYRAGLKVPDDVTIVFPDDNFGYIRQFPTAEEQKRKGGFGVYYHISYLGRPLSYLWLNSTPPGLIFEEMSKAYNNGMRDLWIVNVGDIKPAEIGMEFFLQMAYDSKKWNVRNVDQYLKTWAAREFGDRDASDIGSVMDEYYRLGFARRPEHLQWFLPGEPSKTSDLSEAETLDRLDSYADIRKRAELLYARVSKAKKDAFFELVLYPIRSAALANERFFAADLSAKYQTKWPVAALEWAKRSAAADTEITSETRYFNEALAGGKWRYIMSPEMNAGQWPSMRSTPPKVSLTDVPVQEISGVKPVAPGGFGPSPKKYSNASSFFPEFQRNLSIEAENFQKKLDKNGFGWQVIKGLGKTGDSVSVFPNIARTFSNPDTDSPSIEYDIAFVSNGEISASFYMIPTQPLIPGNGLRIAFAIDSGHPQIVAVDKGTEVSSPKWSMNVLNETSVGTVKLNITEGRHKLRIFAIDIGVVLDKIVFSRDDTPKSYFGPAETIAPVSRPR